MFAYRWAIRPCRGNFQIINNQWATIYTTMEGHTHQPMISPGSKHRPQPRLCLPIRALYDSRCLPLTHRKLIGELQYIILPRVSLPVCCYESRKPGNVNFRPFTNRSLPLVRLPGRTSSLSDGIIRRVTILFFLCPSRRYCS